MSDDSQSLISSLKTINPYYSIPVLTSAFVGLSGYALGFFMAPVAVATVGAGITAFAGVYVADTIKTQYNELSKKLFDMTDEFTLTAKKANDTIDKLQTSVEEVNVLLKQVQGLMQQVEDTKQVENLAEIEKSLKTVIDSVDPQKIKNIVDDVEATTHQVNQDIMQDVTAAVGRFSQATMIFGGPHHQQQQVQAPAPQPQAPAPRAQQNQGRANKR